MGSFLQRERRGEVDEEERRKSISPCFCFHRLKKNKLGGGGW